MTSPSGPTAAATSPVSTGTSGAPSRRRARSTRVATSLVLLGLGAAFVIGAVVAGSWALLTSAAATSVILGVVAHRLTHTELLDTHREAARDRAALAKDYRDLAVVRTAEHQRFVTTVQARMSAQDDRLTEQHARGLEQDARLSQQEVRITELRSSLSTARAEAERARARLASTTARAEQSEREGRDLERRLGDADERAAQAIVRVAELEQELDVVTAQWQAAETFRKHA